MSIFMTLFHVLVTIYRLIAASWNACVVLLRVVQSVMQEAKQEAAELMALLDDGAPVMDAITSASLLHDAGGPVNPGQMLIIARASSFMLLLRLSRSRVLHLEVDEKFIIAKLEVIRSELMLHVQHIPRLLHMPIGMHDTRLVRYTPMRLPYLWKEEQAGPRCSGGGGVAKRSNVSATLASSVDTGGEGRSHRKKYVQLLAESALRRRLHMDRHGGADVVLKRGTGTAKTHGENVVKRKALANATNMGVTHGQDGVVMDGAEPNTPKRVRMERHIHAALSENLSIPNMMQTLSLQRAAEGVHRSGVQSLRRKRGQFDLYAQGVSSEFSLMYKTSQGNV